MDVQLPNGTILRGVPEGTTRSQIQAKLNANKIDHGIEPKPADKKPVAYGRGQLPIPGGTPLLPSENAVDAAMLVPGVGTDMAVAKGLTKLLPAAAEKLAGRMGISAAGGAAGGAAYNTATGGSPATGGVVGGALGAAAPVVGKVAGAVADRLKPADERANTYIAKTLIKGGKTPDQAIESMKTSRGKGLTAGEASKNPELIGMEKKISDMNRPGGEMVRGFAEDRVNPYATNSFPSQLSERATNLSARAKSAGKNIETIASQAGNKPVNMAYVTKPLSQQKMVPGSPESATVKRIQALSNWARSQGNSFQAWHRVKQEIGNLRAVGRNPTTAEKIDMKTVDDYYRRVNDVLSGRVPGLPDSLKQTGNRYAFANQNYAQNLSGDTIKSVLSKMPTKGTPSERLNFLYKNLAGNEETQREVMAGMPPEERRGMMNLLKAINDASRSGLNDVTRTGETSSQGIPVTKGQAFGRFKDWFESAIKGHDYDALGRALTNPDIRYVSKKILDKTTVSSERAAKSGSSGYQVHMSDVDISKVDKFINSEKLKLLGEYDVQLNNPKSNEGLPYSPYPGSNKTTVQERLPYESLRHLPSPPKETGRIIGGKEGLSHEREGGTTTIKPTNRFIAGNKGIGIEREGDATTRPKPKTRWIKGVNPKKLTPSSVKKIKEMRKKKLSLREEDK